jgi:hypothetical protein
LAAAASRSPVACSVRRRCCSAWRNFLGDSVVVVEVQKLLLPAGEFSNAAPVAFGVVASDLSGDFGMRAEGSADRGLLFGR